MTSITHRWPIDYSSTIILRTKDTFSWTIFFICDSFMCVRCIFPCIWSSCWRRWDTIKVLIRNRDDSQLCNISLYSTLTNQYENETNKYADRNRLHCYQFFCGCLSAKQNCFGLGKHPSKALNDRPQGKQWVLFLPQSSMFPKRSWGEHWVQGETKLTVSCGTSH